MPGSETWIRGDVGVRILDGPDRIPDTSAPHGENLAEARMLVTELAV